MKLSILLTLFLLSVLACTDENTVNLSDLGSNSSEIESSLPSASTSDNDLLTPPPSLAPNPFVGTGKISIRISPVTTARYVINEQLVNQSLPNDAVATTRDVDGEIIFNPEGILDRERSIIKVNLRSLQSDSSRRDGYVQNNTLETERFPTATLAIKETPGLPWPIPTSGSSTFKIIGDMTIHGVTSTVQWQTQVVFNDGSVTGKAHTNFTFDKFGLKIPRVFVVISVEDNIRLEIDFTAIIDRNT